MPGITVRGALGSLTWLSFGILAGCVVIPAPEHGLLGGRGEIEESATALLQEAITTRQDVVLRFGEPDLVLGQGRVLAYRWEVSHGYWAVGAYYTGAFGPVPKNYLLMLEFDEKGLLTRWEKTAGIWATPRIQLEKWVSPESAAPLGDGRRAVMVIDPLPWRPASDGSPSRSDRPVRYWIKALHGPLADPKQASLLGHKQAAFGVIVADVRASRPVTELVRSTIASQLEAEGYELASENPDIFLSVEITAFTVTTSLSAATWDAEGSLGLSIQAQVSGTNATPLVRHYGARHVSRTIMGPSRDDFEKVMRACLEDLQHQIAQDPELMGLFDQVPHDR